MHPAMTVRNAEALMDTFTLVLLFLGALAGGFVSGLAGFGTALMALGIWLYVLRCDPGPVRPGGQNSPVNA
jgi:uncharacterized membrane protein YfcA